MSDSRKKPVILHGYNIEGAINTFVDREGLKKSNVVVRISCVEFIPAKKEFHYYFTVGKPCD